MLFNNFIVLNTKIPINFRKLQSWQWHGISACRYVLVIQLFVLVLVTGHFLNLLKYLYLIKIFLIVPATNANSEKKVTTSIRSAMTDSRLNQLLIIHI